MRPSRADCHPCGPSPWLPTLGSGIPSTSGRCPAARSRQLAFSVVVSTPTPRPSSSPSSSRIFRTYQNTARCVSHPPPPAHPRDRRMIRAWPRKTGSPRATANPLPAKAIRRSGIQPSKWPRQQKPEVDLRQPGSVGPATPCNNGGRVVPSCGRTHGVQDRVAVRKRGFAGVRATFSLAIQRS